MVWGNKLMPQGRGLRDNFMRGLALWENFTIRIINIPKLIKKRNDIYRPLFFIFSGM